MLRQAEEFKSFKLRAKDGDIGKPEEFYFDDKHWTIRYLVADTGGWLSGRQVLLSPYALGLANEIDEVLPVNLTKKQIEESPPLETHRPVSRQFEMQYFGYYGWPYYGNGSDLWGASPYLSRDPNEWKDLVHLKAVWDPHLRSTKDVTGHHIQALDGEIGHVEDFIIDEESWSIRYLVVDTKNWWAGKKILISPKWITKVSWEDSKVFITMSQETIKQAPEYKQESISPEYEIQLHQHYQQEWYTPEELQTKK